MKKCCVMLSVECRGRIRVLSSKQCVCITVLGSVAVGVYVTQIKEPPFKISFLFRLRIQDKDDLQAGERRSLMSDVV
jgi:hypothetical protein